MENHFEFINLQLAGMFLIILGLFYLEALSITNYVVVSFIWLLVVAEYTTPPIVKPKWRRKLRWVILICLILFAYVSYEQMITILDPS